MIVTSALLAVLLSTSCVARAAPGDGPLATGSVVDRVTCSADATKSYALYIPSRYTADRAWPILYCFDPGGRGREPVERFAAAAERFGWIVAGSYDSRNGDMRASVEAAAAVWADTHARFKVDDRRVYTAGFSGGARVATYTAIGCGGCVAGVIACGAGFPVPPTGEKLAAPVSFAYFGTVGVDDFNFPEMKSLDGVLAKSGVAHEVARWDGPHDWAPEPLATRAVGWMETRAMRAGTRPADDALLATLYAERLADAKALEAAGRPYDAWLAYAGAAAEFAGLRDAAEAAERAAALGATKEVRDALSREADEVKRQTKDVGEVMALANAAPDQEDPLAAAHEFRSRVARIREAAHVDKDSSERRVARRSLSEIFAVFYEGAAGLSSAGKYDRAAKMLETATVVAPKAGGVYYELAVARARLGDRKRALAALARAAENGFDDAARLKAEPAFEPFRASPEFAKVVDALGSSR